MPLFARKPAADANGDEPVELVRERNALFRRALLSMLDRIKALSLDIEDLDADEFKDRLDTFSAGVLAAAPPSRFERDLADREQDIDDYVAREKKYFAERDAEFSEVIEMLTESLQVLGDDNAKFSTSLETRGQRLEALGRIDDIRRLRSELAREVEEIRADVRAKQKRDQKQREWLRDSLAKAQLDLDIFRAESMSDPLTGVFNRRAMDSALLRLAERCRKEKQPLSVMMLDIDHFKSINDTYGHAVGDRVLVAMVRECRGLLRSEDVMARYGGEEFIVVMPGASLRTAMKRAKKICRAVSKAVYAIDDIDGAANDSQRSISFTVSIGVAQLAEDDATEAAVERADAALYQAKEAGRNRAVSEKQLTK